MTPPIAMPWPPIHLVAEFITMSAPSSIGRLRNGVAKVLSIRSGILGVMRDLRDIRNVQHLKPRIADGLADHQPRVWLDRRANSSSARGLTKVVVMPKRGSVCASKLIVPP